MIDNTTQNICFVYTYLIQYGKITTLKYFNEECTNESRTTKKNYI